MLIQKVTFFKVGKHNKDSLRDLIDNIKHINTCITGILEREDIKG